MYYFHLAVSNQGSQIQAVFGRCLLIRALTQAKKRQNLKSSLGQLRMLDYLESREEVNLVTTTCVARQGLAAAQEGVKYCRGTHFVGLKVW